ncbi:hypothetical protein Taitung233_08750 [Helicobacter pylori]
MKVKKYSSVPKRYKFLQIVNEAEATSFARRNGPIFKVKDNLFSDSSDGGVRSHIRSCINIKWKLSRCRIPSTAHITPYGLDRKVGERSFRARTGKQL